MAIGAPQDMPAARAPARGRAVAVHVDSLCVGPGAVLRLPASFPPRDTSVWP
jgi:hypothetical protein